MRLPIWQLVIDSLTLPRAAARRVMSFGLSYRQAVEATVLVVAVSTMIGTLAARAVPTGDNPVAVFLTSNPLTAVPVQVAVLMAIAFFMTTIGRRFGGTGGHADALALVAWIQAVMIVLQVLQLALMGVSPVFAGLLSLAAIGWFFWALSAFTAQLHGFPNVLKTFGGVFISMVVILVGAGMLLTIAGIQLPELS